MSKEYSIYLGDFLLGTTLLEKSDSPMGMVAGMIRFVDSTMPYNFIKAYCENAQVSLETDNPDTKQISTRTLDELRVIGESGTDIKGIENHIEGSDALGYEIVIVGLPYEMFEDEFSWHLEDYEDSFKCCD